MVEEPLEQKRGKHAVKAVTPQPLSDIPFSRNERNTVGISELDRVLGGGLVPGSLILLGGDPGIGKSTLMLQISSSLAHADRSVLYVNGEESAYQVRMRAERLGITIQGIDVLTVTDLEAIIACARERKPHFMVIDSIQTIYRNQMSSAPGSVAQVRECGGELMRFAKEYGVTIVIIGHVTKFGSIAGPKTLEHMVDTVLYFEGDRNQQYRIIRAIKNRFGSTNEIGVFEMTESGLKEVMNPSSLFMSDSENSGSAIISVMEGTRPLLVEVQALTSPTFFNYPQRITTGVDHKRLAMLLAVLERRVGINVYRVDCFVNVVGGIKIIEPTSDLGILLAIASSIRNIPIDRNTVIIGEVGLGGEVRPVFGIQGRLNEAEKLGFKRALIPHKNTPVNGTKMDIQPVSEVMQAVELAIVK
jgi:DNA repair protein RadA/Sms